MPAYLRLLSPSRTASPDVNRTPSPPATLREGPELDHLVRLASTILRAPFTGILIKENGKVRMVAQRGMAFTEMPEDWSVPFQIGAGTKALAIPDCAADRQLSENPWVKGMPFIRFWLSVPLPPPFHGTGHIFAADFQPRVVQNQDKVLLQDLALQAAALLGKRSQMQIETTPKPRQTESGRDLDAGIILDQNSRLLNFSYIVSHNLRAHTSNIRAILSYLDEARDPEEKEEMMQHLREISNSLDESILHLNQLVAIHRNTSMKVQNLRLWEALEHARSVLLPNLQHESAILENQIPREMTVSFNPAFLESLFLNFITNAIQYRHPDRRPEICVHARTIPGYTILTFRDNGIGIDLMRYRHKIFSLYATLGPGKKGKGVGLFMTKNQVESLQGKIEVDSIPGVGTQFHVFFHSAE